jgi:hypothetical protein
MRHMLGSDGNKAPRSAVENFNFRGLLEELLADNLPSEIFWFGARLRLYEQSDDLRQKSNNAILRTYKGI